MFSDVIVVTLPADLFNQNAQQQEPIIAISPLAARLEFQAALTVELHVILQRAELEPVLVELRAEEITGASRVREQMMDGDFGRQVLVGIVGEILAERVG